jgi:hypothetical protein
MQKVILDPDLQARLKGLADHLEFCDETGRTLGFFLPPDVHHELLYAWAKSQFSDEELEQARRELKDEGGLTTAEAIAYLESVARSARGGA